MLTVSPINFNQRTYKPTKSQSANPQKYSQTAFGIKIAIEPEAEKFIFRDNKWLKSIDNFIKIITDNHSLQANTDSLLISLQANKTQNELQALKIVNVTKGPFIVFRNPDSTPFAEIKIVETSKELLEPNLDTFLSDIISNNNWMKNLSKNFSKKMISGSVDEKVYNALSNKHFHEYISDITQFKYNIKALDRMDGCDIKLLAESTEKGKFLNVIIDGNPIYTMSKDHCPDMCGENLLKALPENQGYEIKSLNYGQVYRYNP